MLNGSHINKNNAQNVKTNTHNVAKQIYPYQIPQKKKKKKKKKSSI